MNKKKLSSKTILQATILVTLLEEVPFTGMRGDHMKTCFLFDKEFKITIPARES